MYLTEKGVVVPHRECGRATVHDNTIVHGTTPIQRGTRYGLFFLHYKGGVM